jgi:hypothetical protein
MPASPERSVPNGRGALPVLALGLNTWLVAVGWPLHSARALGPAQWALAAAALLGISLGAWAQQAGHARSAAVLLWAAFPTALCAASASAYAVAAELAFTPLALGLAPLSLCGYGAAVAAFAPPPRRIAHELSPLTSHAAPPPRSRLPHALLTALFVVGATTLTVILPALSPPHATSSRWGAAVLEGSVLVAVVGGALGVTVIAVFLPAVERRDPRARATRGDASLRIAWLLFVSLVGAATYVTVQP